MSFPSYLAFYLAEHAAYQAGVAAGCIRARSFRSYLPTFERQGAPGALTKGLAAQPGSQVGSGS